MARLVPQPFPTPQETAIATYNFTDIIEGSGIIQFYGFNTRADTTLNYVLTANSALLSHDLGTSTSTSGGGFSKDIDDDYDITFNRTHTLKGAGYCNIVTHQSSNANEGCSQYFIIKLVHYDGSTETTLATGQTETYLSGSTAAPEYKTNCVPLSISTARHFKKGDILRVTVEGWSNRTSGSGNIGYLHDPVGSRTPTNAEDSKLSIFVPFQLDI